MPRVPVVVILELLEQEPDPPVGVVQIEPTGNVTNRDASTRVRRMPPRSTATVRLGCGRSSTAGRRWRAWLARVSA